MSCSIAMSIFSPHVTSFGYIIIFKARLLFLAGQKHLNEAMEFYKLDGYVTHYVEIVQDHSQLFKYLAFFDTDLERQCKMCKRRADMLSAVLSELNPQHYLLAHLRNRVRVRRHGRAEDVYHSERQADRAISASNEEDQFLVGSEHEILYFLFGLVEAGGEITREVRRVHGSRCALGAHVSREDLFQEDLSDEGAEDRELEKIARVVSVCRGVLRRR